MAQSIAPDQVANGDVLWSQEFMGRDGTNNIVVGRIQCIVDGTPSAGKIPSKIVFSTMNTAGAITSAFALSAAQVASFTAAMTLTGGIGQLTAPMGFFSWQPIAATSGTDTAFASGTLFVASVFVPVNKTITGIGYLLGSVGGTDKVVVQLNSAAGALLANSTLTAGGTTAGTAANTQEIAFTATYAAVGPAMYYIGVSANGATAKLRTVPAFCNAGMFANSLTQTVSVPAAIAGPTTFTADKGPIAYVY